jgi:hypothetical protein
VGDNDMLCNSGFDMKVNPDHNMLLLVPNAKQFYDHIEHSVKKVKEESAMGILQGPFPGLPFVPAQTVENSYVVQKSKERRIGRGDAPYNFLWNDKDCSINANIWFGFREQAARGQTCCGSAPIHPRIHSPAVSITQHTMANEAEQMAEIMNQLIADAAAAEARAEAAEARVAELTRSYRPGYNIVFTE